MSENSYFQNALSNFTHEVASGGAIRHLTDLGYTARQIEMRLDFPTPLERIQKEMWQHLVETEVILLEEPGSRKREKTTYVREYDKFGKASFRRVVETEGEEIAINWREKRVETENVHELQKLLKEKLDKNGKDFSYASCDFGLTAEKDPMRFQELLQILNREPREYVEGLPWKCKRVYHRLDDRMEEILLRLFGQKEYQGTCFFLKTGEKLYLGGKELFKNNF